MTMMKTTKMKRTMEEQAKIQVLVLAQALKEMALVKAELVAMKVVTKVVLRRRELRERRRRRRQLSPLRR